MVVSEVESWEVIPHEKLRRTKKTYLETKPSLKNI